MNSSTATSSTSSTFGAAGAAAPRPRPHIFGPAVIGRPRKGEVIVVLGGQSGDESKGKIVAAAAAGAHIVARASGGANAGHTVVRNGRTHKFHLVPSGILEPVVAVIGNGTVVDPKALLDEMDALAAAGVPDVDKRLLVSDRAHVVFELDKTMDALNEQALERAGVSKIGTTGRGIGPAYATKAGRSGVRFCDYVDPAFDLRAALQRIAPVAVPLITNVIDRDVARAAEIRGRLRPLVVDTLVYLATALEEGKTILVEGAQAANLDIDFGPYPFVTSSSCTAGGVATGLGIPPCEIDNVVAVVKAYATRVGEGPFPTELRDEIGKRIAEVGREVGTTTGRPRRCGWIDVRQIVHGHTINRYKRMVLAKLDVLSGLETLRVCVDYYLDGRLITHVPASTTALARAEPHYHNMPGWSEDIGGVRRFEDLPVAAQNYVRFIASATGVPICAIGVGADEAQTIECDIRPE